MHPSCCFSLESYLLVLVKFMITILLVVEPSIEDPWWFEGCRCHTPDGRQIQERSFLTDGKGSIFCTFYSMLVFMEIPSVSPAPPF